MVLKFCSFFSGTPCAQNRTVYGAFLQQPAACPVFTCPVLRSMCLRWASNTRIGSRKRSPNFLFAFDHRVRYSVSVGFPRSNYRFESLELEWWLDKSRGQRSEVSRTSRGVSSEERCTLQCKQFLISQRQWAIEWMTQQWRNTAQNSGITNVLSRLCTDRSFQVSRDLCRRQACSRRKGLHRATSSTHCLSPIIIMIYYAIRQQTNTSSLHAINTALPTLVLKYY